MYILMGIIIVVLMILNVWQYRRTYKLRLNIDRVMDDLRAIREQYPDKKLLMVTADKTLEKLLLEVNYMLEKQTHTKVQFRRKEQSMEKMLANISHDLKTPLTVVLGYIETLQNNPAMDRDEQNVMLEQMHDKVMEIIEMINTFFNLAKLESGDKNISLERINAAEVCKNNLLTFYDHIHAKGLEAAIDIPDVPLYIWGNDEALASILRNLLSNAINYGSEGGVVGMSLTYNSRNVAINIWDAGPGIPESMQERIFGRMFTMEESRNKFFQGSGLGLAITKRFVEEMDGTITIHSTPYQKTSFTITLKRLTF